MHRHIDAVLCLQHVDCGLFNVRKTGHKPVGPALRWKKWTRRSERKRNGTEYLHKSEEWINKK